MRQAHELGQHYHHPGTLSKSSTKITQTETRISSNEETTTLTQTKTKVKTKSEFHENLEGDLATLSDERATSQPDTTIVVGPQTQEIKLVIDNKDGRVISSEPKPAQVWRM